MCLSLTAQQKLCIVRQYDKAMARYPRRRRAVEAVLAGLEPLRKLCLQFLYGSMHPNDVLTLSPSLLAEQVDVTLRLFGRLDYVETIPADLFCAYVLSHRVNCETWDASRAMLQAQLLPLVDGASMTQAALTVNLWCAAHASYAPADDRTLGPLGVLRRTWGRCGEESVLLVSALRSVGLPARQVYVPRWSHCNDNHAWVEVWTDGQWHYLGACEPEPALDRGWFTAAASRAMLIHTKVWSCFPDPEAMTAGPVCQLVNVTARYARTARLTVTVTKNGVPAAGIPVEFQINNESTLFPLHRQAADAQGIVSVELGLGGLCVAVEQQVIPVDLRQTRELTVELDAVPVLQEFSLVPPAEAPVEPLLPVPPEHLAHLEQCRRALARRRSALAAPVFAAELQPVLDTLREKDLADLDPRVLSDALAAALPFRDQYPEDLWRRCLLAPRIADETLLPDRMALQALRPPECRTGGAVSRWMDEHLQRLPDWGLTSFSPGVLACVEAGQVPEGSWELVFAALCRAWGIPARLDPLTAMGQWWDGDWHDRIPTDRTLLTLTGMEPVTWGEGFTLSRWDGRAWITLQQPGLVVDGSVTVPMPTGWYRLLTTTRQIDGTASTRLLRFTLKAPRAVALELPEDQSAEKLLQLPILPLVPEGEVREVLEQGAALLLFSDPGAEPTEHLLRELLACREDRDFPIHLFADGASPTLEALCRLPGVYQHPSQPPEVLELLHRAARVGDRRLPFVLLQDRNRQLIYAAANYQIGQARTLLRLQRLSEA